jgi:hypothetical protein
MAVWKIKVGKWRIAVGILPTTKCVGVYSSLGNDKHILMWDFDDKPFGVVIKELRAAQKRYKLPRIYILNTGQPQHYIAYCFKVVDFPTAREILASCHSIDSEFYRLGVYRGRWTLRVGPKCGRYPYLVGVLKSRVQEDCNARSLNDWVIYETVVDGYENKVKEIGKE